MRGLLVTPWFAAGAGFVIAAALALNSPHTVLTYKPNTSTCSTCGPPQSLATAKPGVVLPSAPPVRRPRLGERARAAVGARHLLVGPTIGYRVVTSQNGTFVAVITVPRAEGHHRWILRFEIPGRRILAISGAQWAPAPGGYGGTVSSLANPAQPWAPNPYAPPESSQSAPPGQPDPPGEPGRPSQRVPAQRGFLVIAQGTPRTPVECVLNGVSCHFG